MHFDTQELKEAIQAAAIRVEEHDVDSILLPKLPGLDDAVDFSKCTLIKLMGREEVYGIFSQDLMTMIGVTSDPNFLDNDNSKIELDADKSLSLGRPSAFAKEFFKIAHELHEACQGNVYWPSLHAEIFGADHYQGTCYDDRISSLLGYSIKIGYCDSSYEGEVLAYVQAVREKAAELRDWSKD